MNRLSVTIKVTLKIITLIGLWPINKQKQVTLISIRPVLSDFTIFWDYLSWHIDRHYVKYFYIHLSCFPYIFCTLQNQDNWLAGGKGFNSRADEDHVPEEVQQPPHVREVVQQEPQVCTYTISICSGPEYYGWLKENTKKVQQGSRKGRTSLNQVYPTMDFVRAKRGVGEKD